MRPDFFWNSSSPGPDIHFPETAPEHLAQGTIPLFTWVAQGRTGR